MLDFRAFQPVLGRKFDVEFEFEVRNSRFKRPEGKNKENIPHKIWKFDFLIRFLYFFIF